MADGLDQTGLTVKDWLQRIDAKQDKLDEKIDSVASSMDRKADDRDLRTLIERVLVLEQVNAQRLELYNRMDTRVENVVTGVSNLKEDKADRADVAAVWRVLVSALAGSAIAILAWALTAFVG